MNQVLLIVAAVVWGLGTFAPLAVARDPQTNTPLWLDRGLYICGGLFALGLSYLIK